MWGDTKRMVIQTAIDHPDFTAAEIAALAGIHPGSVRKVIVRAGLTLPSAVEKRRRMKVVSVGFVKRPYAGKP